MRTRTTLLCSLVCVVFSRSVCAQDNVDELTTNQGVRLRGHLGNVSVETQRIDFETEERVEHLSWQELRTLHGPSFENFDSTAQSTLPVTGRVFVRLESEQRQLVEIMWGVAANEETAPPTHARLYRARCHTPCTLQVPPVRMLVQAQGRNVRRSSFPFLPHPTGSIVQLRSASAAIGDTGEGLLFAGIGSALYAGSIVSLAYAIDPHFMAANTEITMIIAGGIAGLSLLGSLVGLLLHVAAWPGIQTARPLPAPQLSPAVSLTNAPSLGLALRW